MRDLATVTGGDFKPLEGASLDVTLPTGTKVQGTLRDLKVQPPWGPGQREGFSFGLLVPEDPKGPPEQGMIRLGHASFGELELFAVPTAKTAAGVEWYIVVS